MAIIKNNVLTEGLSGMLGNKIVFRNWNGRTIVARRPRSPRKQSAQQKSNRERFKEATLFAKAVTKDPVKKEYYKQKAKVMLLPNAYTAAITDYMRRPVIDSVVVNDESIVISVIKKNFDVTSVVVVARDINNVVVEKGGAVPANDGNWTYAFINSDVISSMMILVKDGPGNCVDKNILVK